MQNAIERAVVLGQPPNLRPEDLPPCVTAERAGLLKKALKEGVTLEALEREYIEQILKKTQGHQSLTANILGIDRRTLYRKSRKYHLEGCEG
ncbi:MAG: hypothetical protein HY673_25580 [Chloroflexi bacterium]|nr:hypothetical protein [Chloroflexota bacterium]